MSTVTARDFAAEIAGNQPGVSGDLLFIVLILVVALLLAWGIFGRQGSGIASRPWWRRAGPAEAQAGAEVPEDQEAGAADEGRPPMTHGTR